MLDALTIAVAAATIAVRDTLHIPEIVRRPWSEGLTAEWNVSEDRCYLEVSPTWPATYNLGDISEDWAA